MNPQHYPLQWPPGWQRAQFRERARFKTTLPSALSNLKKQIELMGGSQVILSSNCTLGHENPRDPGVVAYFLWSKKQLAVPCDRWDRVESNVQAIALTVEAMRGMERWGAKHMIEAMFTGFKLLPAGESRAWWQVLGVDQSASLHQAKEAFRALAPTCHPDTGGTNNAMAELNAAWQTAQTVCR